MNSNRAADTSSRERTLLRMTHRHPRLAYSVLLALSLAAACDQGDTPIGGFEPSECPDPSAGDTVADGGDPPAEAIAIDCSFSFADNTQTFTFEANVEYEPRVVGGDLNLTATLFDDDFEGRSFQISIYDVDGSVGNVAIYQFAPGTRPVNEFWGQHGFTGLNWVQDPLSGDNVQYACFARDPADPVQSWED
jgi:hypothetical protein